MFTIKPNLPISDFICKGNNILAITQSGGQLLLITLPTNKNEAVT